MRSGTALALIVLGCSASHGDEDDGRLDAGVPASEVMAGARIDAAGPSAVDASAAVRTPPADADGFGCGGDTCAPGEACINCDFFGDAIYPTCVPHPDSDASGFASATAGCPGVNRWYECDGAEDCAPGEYCVTSPAGGADFPLGACAPEPCTASPGCTLCNDDGDCPDGARCDQEHTGILGSALGCGPG